MWVRADSHNGYISDVDVYTGRDDSTETNLGTKVVKKLSQPLIGGNYHLYFDNFFSSVTLFQDLVEDGIYACGTFRKDRKGLPEVVKNTKLGMLCCYYGKYKQNNKYFSYLSQVTLKGVRAVFGRGVTWS